MSEFTGTASGWEARLAALLPQFGHRNWIVVADAAYPAQARAGIETIVAAADQLQVLRKVIEKISASKHIKATAYRDLELNFISEQDAPGIGSYRAELEHLLANSKVFNVLHEQIIARLDQTAEVFHVLIIKTELTIPYTSVFFELDCGYWTTEAEQRLREAILTADVR